MSAEKIEVLKVDLERPAFVELRCGAVAISVVLLTSRSKLSVNVLSLDANQRVIVGSGTPYESWNKAVTAQPTPERKEMVRTAKQLLTPNERNA